MTDRLQLYRNGVVIYDNFADGVPAPVPPGTPTPPNPTPIPPGPTPPSDSGTITGGQYVNFYANAAGDTRDFPFVAPGVHLSVNVNPVPGGAGQMTSTTAMLLDAAGTPLPGYTWPMPSLGDGVISFYWDFTPGASYVMRVCLVGGGAASVQVMGP